VKKRRGRRDENVFLPLRPLRKISASSAVNGFRLDVVIELEVPI